MFGELMLVRGMRILGSGLEACSVSGFFVFEAVTTTLDRGEELAVPHTLSNID